MIVQAENDHKVIYRPVQRRSNGSFSGRFSLDKTQKAWYIILGGLEVHTVLNSTGYVFLQRFLIISYCLSVSYDETRIGI